MEEILKACEGKLGQYYKLALRTKLEKDEINRLDKELSDIVIIYRY